MLLELLQHILAAVPTPVLACADARTFAACTPQGICDSGASHHMPSCSHHPEVHTVQKLPLPSAQSHAHLVGTRACNSHTPQTQPTHSTQPTRWRRCFVWGVWGRGCRVHALMMSMMCISIDTSFGSQFCFRGKENRKLVLFRKISAFRLPLFDGIMDVYTSLRNTCTPATYIHQPH